jgi:phage I-like protein
MSRLFVAFNQILQEGVAPDWVQLLPSGPKITGRDGRTWLLNDPQTVIESFQQRDIPMCLDFEHSSEHRAPQGLDAPAAGWIDQLEARNGAIWAHVDWTAKAAAQIAAREYRFLSPVFTYRKADSAIVALTSAGLTNQPNLNLTALNRAEGAMSIPVSILNILGLTETATEADVLAAIKVLQNDEVAEDAAGEPADTNATAAQRAVQPLTKFVPRADYDATLLRAANAEKQLAAINQARKAQDVDALIESALQARKISPATQSYYRAMCQTEGGIAAFKEFLNHAPALIGDAPGLAGTPPEPPADQILTRAFNRHTLAKPSSAKE